MFGRGEKGGEASHSDFEQKTNLGMFSETIRSFLPIFEQSNFWTPELSFALILEKISGDLLIFRPVGVPCMLYMGLFGGGGYDIYGETGE